MYNNYTSTLGQAHLSTKEIIENVTCFLIIKERVMFLKKILFPMERIYKEMEVKKHIYWYYN